MIAATELSAAQTRRGIGHLRVVGAAEHLTPLNWTRRDGYRFSDEPADWISYERACFLIELSRLTRLMTATIAPHAARIPDDDWVHMVLDQITGIRSALAFMGRPG